MARIARRNGSLSSGQASMTFRKSGQAGEIGALIGASDSVFPRQSAVFGRFETCSAHHSSLFEPRPGKPAPAAVSIVYTSSLWGGLATRTLRGARASSLDEDIFGAVAISVAGVQAVAHGLGQLGGGIGVGEELNSVIQRRFPLNHILAVTAGENDGQMGVGFLEFFGQFPAGHAFGHDDVAEEEIHFM